MLKAHRRNNGEGVCRPSAASSLSRHNAIVMLCIVNDTYRHRIDDIQSDRLDHPTAFLMLLMNVCGHCSISLPLIAPLSHAVAFLSVPVDISIDQKRGSM